MVHIFIKDKAPDIDDLLFDGTFTSAGPFLGYFSAKACSSRSSPAVRSGSSAGAASGAGTAPGASLTAAPVVARRAHELATIVRDVCGFTVVIIKTTMGTCTTTHHSPSAANHHKSHQSGHSCYP
ncbi:hypothetical protein ACTFIV_005171 [Dictyostelium citrinum]